MENTPASLESLAAALKAAGLRVQMRTDLPPDRLMIRHPSLSSVGLSVVVDHVPPVGVLWFRSSGGGWLGPCEDLARVVAEIRDVLEGLVSPDAPGAGS